MGQLDVARRREAPGSDGLLQLTMDMVNWGATPAAVLSFGGLLDGAGAAEGRVGLDLTLNRHSTRGRLWCACQCGAWLQRSASSCCWAIGPDGLSLAGHIWTRPRMLGPREKGGAHHQEGEAGSGETVSGLLWSRALDQPKRI